MPVNSNWWREVRETASTRVYADGIENPQSHPRRILRHRQLEYFLSRNWGGPCGVCGFGPDLSNNFGSPRPNEGVGGEGGLPRRDSMSLSFRIWQSCWGSRRESMRRALPLTHNPEAEKN
jgi:hypothetical protein